jgi:hypothetical protein
MKTTLLALATALALGALAGCDRTPDERAKVTPPTSAPAGAGGTATRQSDTPTTPANVGQPQSQAEKKDGANPVQQQVDPKEAEQQRDFRTKGDGAGPKQPGG